MNYLLASLRLGWQRLTSRRIYLFAMVLLPLAFMWFFASLMDKGLPIPVPTAVVDMDQSSLSRRVVRSLTANQYLEITTAAESYEDAMAKVKTGEVYGFFYIPRNFERDALNGSQPSLTLYSNMSIFIPGTMAYKGFKTIAVTTKGGLVSTALSSIGATPGQIGPMLQPIAIQDHPIGNPWMSYSIYLDNSFLPGVLVLMIMLVTAFSVTIEIKDQTSPQWLKTGGGSMTIALLGKLLPQTLIFSVVGILMQAIMFGFMQFPLHCSAFTMIVAMVMLVISSQAFALMLCELTPNPRLGLTLTGLLGILSFSVLGFSFPVDQMYGAIGIFSWIMPLRYYFLIYIDQALNGIDLWYSRWWFIALCIFPLLPLLGLKRLRKACQKPVYIP
mgnify:FL=1